MNQACCILCLPSVLTFDIHSKNLSLSTLSVTVFPLLFVHFTPWDPYFDAAPHDRHIVHPSDIPPEIFYYHRSKVTLFFTYNNDVVSFPLPPESIFFIASSYSTTGKIGTSHSRHRVVKLHFSLLLSYRYRPHANILIYLGRVSYWHFDSFLWK